VNDPFVVIGGGIVGSAIAFELQQRGAKTILVERDADPHGASAFSFASISAFDEPLIDVYLLKSAGLVGWRRWSKELGYGIGLTKEGEIRWAETEAAATHLRSLIDRAARRGYPVREISPEEVAERLPGSVTKNVIAASLAWEDAQADPLMAIATLRRAFLEAGGEVVVGRATLLFGESSVRVQVGAATIESSQIVIAAGAHTAAFLEGFGWEIPMDPSPGLLLRTKGTEPFLTGTVYVSPLSGPEIHLRQLPDGRALIGERAQDQVARHPTERHTRKLLRQARQSFPALSSVEVDGFTIEWRPMPRDGMPIVGPLPGVPQLYVVAAHAGVTLAPVLGELVSRELVERMSSARLEPFRPSRFIAHRTEADRSIQEAFDVRWGISLG
jgi:glycine/D-amino acid oxidase-like deaminating enzyme